MYGRETHRYTRTQRDGDTINEAYVREYTMLAAVSMYIQNQAHQPALLDASDETLGVVYSRMQVFARRAPLPV